MSDIDLPATIARLRAFYSSLRSPRSHEQDMMHVIEQLLAERAADKARIAELERLLSVAGVVQSDRDI